jgi:hypothetical protein
MVKILCILDAVEDVCNEGMLWWQYVLIRNRKEEQNPPTNMKGTTSLLLPFKRCSFLRYAGRLILTLHLRGAPQSGTRFREDSTWKSYLAHQSPGTQSDRCNQSTCQLHANTYRVEMTSQGNRCLIQANSPTSISAFSLLLRIIVMASFCSHKDLTSSQSVSCQHSQLTN